MGTHGSLPGRQPCGRRPLPENGLPGELVPALRIGTSNPLPVGDTGICSRCSHNTLDLWNCVTVAPAAIDATAAVVCLARFAVALKY